MSDERERADAPGDDEDGRGQTAVVTKPLRPTGKRSRQALTTDDGDGETDTESTGDGKVKITKNGDGKPKTKKAAKDSGPSRNPIAFIFNYLKEVVAELRKVIWPNRKQMVSYTTVVLVFLVFMVALIGVVDLGLAKLMLWVFG